MASAQIQLFYNTATSSTTTTKPTAYTTCKNISCCQKEATTLSTTLFCQYTENSKPTTTTAAEPTKQSSPGISVINRKQSSPKTDISKSSSNDNEKTLDTSNKLAAEKSQTATTTTTTLPATIIACCHQATVSNQHSRINTKNGSSIESVPATTATLQLQTQIQQKSFSSASSSTASPAQWPGKRNTARKYGEGGEKSTKQQDREPVDISTSAAIDDKRRGENQSGAASAAGKRQRRCIDHNIQLAVAGAAAGDGDGDGIASAKEMFSSDNCNNCSGAEYESTPILNAAFSCEKSAAPERDGELVESDDGATSGQSAAFATFVVGGEEDGETVSVNINIASSYRSDCCANEDIRNRTFTGIYKRIVVIEEEQDQKQEETTSSEIIARDNNDRTSPTTKCCPKVYASDALLHQVDSCNNVADANKCCLQRYRKINASFHSGKQKQRSLKSRLSSITTDTAAEVSSKSHCRQSTKNVSTHRVQHTLATFRDIQHSTRQRNLHTNKKTNSNDQQQQEKLNTSNTQRYKIPSKFVAMGTARSLGRLSASSFSGFLDFQKFTNSIFSLLIILNLLPLFYAECDQTFVSRIGGPQNGTFSAPLLHNPKNHSRQCLYTFLAGPGQRVEVVFTSFNLRGSPPDGSAVGELPTCVHEYMDIYSEVQSSDPAELINSPFGGRYCGTIPPRRRISMYRAIAISFFSSKNISMPDLFEGRYRFINASEYEIGIPIAGSPCSYTITPSMSVNKTGALISPTYPGAYPKDMSCTYQFLGESNQRVRLEFRDFDLFFGGPHCPFDYVKIYDGPDNSSALIGTYCGQQRNLVLYSSESSLFVHFFTLPRTANTQNRGFKGIYEFSESFVKLDFIRENDGIHIRGSECDQKILSRKESTGAVLSPNYPYPYIPKTVCRYFIYGMQDAQHLERVRLEFSAFNIPKVEHKDKSESNCTDGYLKIYLKGQETADAYDKFDYELCGNETQRVVSDGPRLAMVFSSGELQGRGFKGKYTFETEYKIPGTAAPDGTCSFTYVSSSKKRGDLNSPRYPSNYPSATNCSYLFLAEPNEQVTIVFDHFKVKADGNTNATAGAYGSGACFEDWLEMYLVYRDNNDRFLGRYCGLTSPGPVESPRGAVGLRITLHTDQENVASGFKARYFFEEVKSEVGDCGGNFSNEDSGIITSPNYPAQYKAPGKGMASMACNWLMTARPGYKLSINFEHFSIEGDPAIRGCPAAVLRLWVNVDSDQPPLELCGEKPPIEQWHYISTGQTARISFTTSDKTVGAQGFRIVWTEIQDSGPGPPSIGLLCESTYHFQCEVGYCISDKLRCDGVKNCGPGDDSDELHCITEAPEEDHGVLIIITLVVVSFLICLLCTLYHSRRKRRHHPRQLGGGLHRNAAHYDSTTSATGLSSSRRHLQAGGSISGSLHGINSGTLIIPPAPLPPTSLPPPPHICISSVGAGIGSGMLLNAIGDDVVILGDDDNDDDDNDNDNINEDEDQHHQHLHHRHHHDIYINDVRFDEASLEQLNRLGNV